MTSDGNNLHDFPEIVPTREITTKTEKTFLVLSITQMKKRPLNVPAAAPWPRGAYFVMNGPNAAASTAPTLFRHRLCQLSMTSLVIFLPPRPTVG